MYAKQIQSCMQRRLEDVHKAESTMYTKQTQRCTQADSKMYRTRSRTGKTRTGTTTRRTKTKTRTKRTRTLITQPITISAGSMPTEISEETILLITITITTGILMILVVSEFLHIEGIIPSH